MEEKLFWLGILMGVYAWTTHLLEKRGKFQSNNAVAGWHALFCAIASFMGVLVLTISLGNRDALSPSAGMFTMKQLTLSFAAALAGGLWGLWRARRKFKALAVPRGKQGRGSAKTVRDMYLKEDHEWAETVFSAVLLASFIMYFFVQAFKIPSGSMKTTFLEGDHLFVNKLVYGIRIPLINTRIAKFRPIKREDVIVFQFPSTSPAEIQCGGTQYGRDFIKRVIGLPGDIVEVRQGMVTVNDKPLSEDYAQYIAGGRIPGPRMEASAQDYQRYWEKRELGKMYGERIRDNFGPVKVPQGQYFVMGDNRDRSCDSRYWGGVPEEMVKGKAWFIYWPPGRMHGVR